MLSLSEADCQRCHETDSPLSASACDNYLQRLEGWEIETVNGVQQLTRTFTFKNFVEALDFTNAVGDIAETADHHPALLTEWGKVKVSWWTHLIGGLHPNDFILAARTNALYE